MIYNLGLLSSRKSQIRLR